MRGDKYFSLSSGVKKRQKTYLCLFLIRHSFPSSSLPVCCSSSVGFSPSHLLSSTCSAVASQGDRMDREAMKCQVLTVSNHSCESLTVVGNTLECTVPTQLQAATAKELQVEVRHARSPSNVYFLVLLTPATVCKQNTL